MMILSTAALIPYKKDERRDEYYEATKKLIELSNKIDPACGVCVIESTGNEIPSLFNELLEPSKIVYTKTNNPNLRNKGVNEFVSIAYGLDELFYRGRISPDECVIKVTGRYQFEDTAFIEKAHELIDKNNTHDVVAYHHPDGQIFTGCMAIRAKHLYNFSQSVDYRVIEERMINIEYVCAQWASAQKTFFVDRLGIVGKCAHGNPFRW